MLSFTQFSFFCSGGEHEPISPPLVRRSDKRPRSWGGEDGRESNERLAAPSTEAVTVGAPVGAPRNFQPPAIVAQQLLITQQLLATNLFQQQLAASACRRTLPSPQLQGPSHRGGIDTAPRMAKIFDLDVNFWVRIGRSHVKLDGMIVRGDFF